MISEEMNRRFDSKYVVVAESGCWIWTGMERGGYGRITREDDRKKYIAAHRYSYERFNGAIPDGFDVCHRCDVGLCVNPDHLWAGTRGDNNRDREEKGRGGQQVGSEHHASKMSERDVAWLRSCGLSTRKAAEILGVSQSTAWRAARGFGWKHVTQNLAKANSAPGGSRHSIAQNRQSDKGKTQ